MRLSAKQHVDQFLAVARKYGWRWEIRGKVVTIKKSFPPGDMDGFRECDMMYYSILECAPRTSPGSDWGTDGGGIGAISAISNGVFTMHRSGISSSFAKELSKRS